MTQKQRRIAMAALSLSLSGSAVWCFYKAVQCFNGGIMWVAITSSNPHPSETAKVMGPYWMKKATNWFWSGIVLLILLILSFVINHWIKKRTAAKSMVK